MGCGGEPLGEGFTPYPLYCSWPQAESKGACLGGLKQEHGVWITRRDGFLLLRPVLDQLKDLGTFSPEKR